MVRPSLTRLVLPKPTISCTDPNLPISPDAFSHLTKASFKSLTMSSIVE
jgi:hypothetical protein